MKISEYTQIYRVKGTAQGNYQENSGISPRYKGFSYIYVLTSYIDTRDDAKALEQTLWGQRD